MSKPRIFVLYPKVPFVVGGTEKLAETLCEKLNSREVSAEVLTVPFRWQPKEEVIREALSWRMLNLDADMVIPLKFPAYFVKHKNKVPWLQHQFRQLYELHGTAFSGFSNNMPDGELRESLVSFDTTCLKESKFIYTNSGNTQNRLEAYNGLRGEVLYPPPMNIDALHNSEYGDYFFAAGRLEESKRFDLLLKAMAETESEVRIKIAGQGPDEGRLKELVEKLDISEKVEFLGFVGNEDLVNYYAHCCAVHFAPYDEDYGLIAVEALHSGKAIITASDAGGPTELVKDGENGYVLPPEPAIHAKKLDAMWNDRKLCKTLGQAGAGSVSEINWDHVLESFLKWL